MKNPPLHRYATRPGLYFTDDGGADAVVRSETADQVWFCVLEPLNQPSAFYADAVRLFNEPDVSFIEQAKTQRICTRRIPSLNLRETLFHMDGPNYGLWYVHLPKAWDGMQYGYRVNGPWDPNHGVSFNPYKLLLDPYAKGIEGKMELDPGAFAYECEIKNGKVAGSPFGPMSTVDSLGHMPVSVAIDDRDINKHMGEPSHPHVPWSKTVIYELHVKGFTANAPWLPPELRGTYAGLAHPATLSYLQDLGVTSIELLPIQAKQSELFLQERNRTNYWGYSTLGYFAPEASYATKQAQEAGAGAVRQEVIDMVRAMHEAGFEVIMDVVYNHTCESGPEGPTICWRGLDNLAYYRRTKDKVSRLYDTTGCGNSLDFTNTHVTTFAVDSLRYWAKRIGIDGFRFDLMGLIDTDTMNAVRASLDALPGGKDLIMYGEPWAAGPSSTLPGTELANKEGLHLLDSRIGHFCDRTRDAIKGHVFERRIKGYVNGNAHDTKPQIELAVDAWRAPETNEGNAGQIIQYVSAHDDWTLWDKLCLSMIGDDSPESANKAESGHADDSHRTLESRDDALEHAYRAMPGTQTRKVLEANALAAGLIYTAAGIPFMLAGEEFGKTKFGNDNSFDSGVKVNELDWARAERMQGLVDYYRRLIAVRRANPGLFDAEHIAVEAPGNAVAYRSDDIAVLVNPDDEEYSLPVERIDSAFADSLHDDLPATPESASHAEARWVCVLDSSGTSTGEFRQTGIRIAGGGFPMPARTLSIWKRER